MGETVPASVLRDAVLRTAPQDKVRGLRYIASDLIGFTESAEWDRAFFVRIDTHSLSLPRLIKRGNDADVPTSSENALRGPGAQRLQPETFGKLVELHEQRVGQRHAVALALDTAFAAAVAGHANLRHARHALGRAQVL